MLDQGSVRTKVSKIFTCNCWPRNRFAIGLLPDLRPEQISNHWASRVRTIDQASRPFGPSVRTLDRVIWPKSPRFVRIVGRVYPILSGVLHSTKSGTGPDHGIFRSARPAPLVSTTTLQYVHILSLVYTSLRQVQNAILPSRHV